jgi:hypothetical protein
MNDFYHPLVRWMAGRLQLQQELAADALAARFAGGRDLYLRTLSRLALKQDGRSPYWPARAFLSARGTLIRRIAMLQDQSVTVDRPWSRTYRLSAGLCLLGAAVGVATLRGPTLGAENEKPSIALEAAGLAPRETKSAAAEPFDLTYLPENMPGMVAFRPAATFHRTGMPGYIYLFRDFGIELAGLAKELGIDTSKPGRLKLGPEDIEWIIGGVDIGRTKNTKGKGMHRLQFGTLTVRTTGPFDWLQLLREWRLEVNEVRAGTRVFYKVTGTTKQYPGWNPCVYLPDDRTIVLDEEAAIQRLVRRENPVVPAYLAGRDWEPFRRSLVAVAINNQGGAFAKSYDMGRADDAVVLSLFKGVDRWFFGVDDADAIGLHATATCRGDASESIARSVESLVKMARRAVDHPGPGATASESHDRALRMIKTLLTNLRVGRGDHAVDLRAEGFGMHAELGAIVDAELRKLEKAAQNQHGSDRSK